MVWGPMVRRRSVRIAAAHAPAVLDALVTTYSVKADALAVAAAAYQDAGEPLTAVEDARRELAEAEDALDAVGWRAAPPVRELELAGPAGFVREVLYAALLAATETAGEVCREYEAGRADSRALAAAVADVTALHDHFASVEAADGVA
jgi:hypothetical protein